MVAQASPPAGYGSVPLPVHVRATTRGGTPPQCQAEVRPGTATLPAGTRISRMNANSNLVGRAVLCPTLPANERIRVHPNGAHGVTRPTNLIRCWTRVSRMNANSNLVGTSRCDVPAGAFPVWASGISEPPAGNREARAGTAPAVRPYQVGVRIQTTVGRRCCAAGMMMGRRGTAALPPSIFHPRSSISHLPGLAVRKHLEAAGNAASNVAICGDWKINRPIIS